MWAGRIAVAVSFAIFGAFALPERQPAEPAATSRLFATAFLPIYWIAAGLAWRASRTAELDAGGRRAWRLLAVAHALLAVDNALFFASRHVGGFPGQATLIAVVLPCLWYAAMFAGLARLTRRMATGLERATFWIDAATVLVSGLLILLYVFVHTPGESSLASPVKALTTIGFPALNGAVIFAAVVVILRPGPGVARGAVGLLAVGVALTVVADLAYGRAAAIGAHRPGIWYEPLHLLAACFSAASAQVQRERPKDEGAREVALGSTRSSLLPYVAVLAAVLVVLLEVGDRWQTTLGRMVVGAVGLTGLVMARQLLARRHLAALAAAERARLARQAALEVQLQQAQKLEAVGLLAGGIAHDFNNILTAIRASAELAATSDAASREDVDDIVRAVEHGASLTRQLLAFGRRDAVQVQRFDLRDVVRDMDTMLRRVVTGEIVLRVTLPRSGVPVEMDRGQVEQVLLNLAINARDAMPNGGTLAISVGTTVLEAPTAVLGAGRYATLAVTDTGHGMTPDVIARMFEPFYTTKPRGRGSGLGLSTVYAIVSRAGGAIDVTSAVGAGTTFELRLPLAAAPAGDAGADAAPDAVAAPSEPPARQAVVLVVDDESAIREAVRRYLSRNGYVVIAAAEATEALGHLASPGQRVDLLLTDLTMPGMSGRALIDRARALDPALRVICMSGYAERAAGDGDAMPPANCIEKPFSLGTLGRLVRATLDAPAA
jgi:signal transduction histidine kinase